MAQVYISQYARRAAVADSVEGTASYAAVAGIVNPIRLDPIQDPNPTGLLYPSSTYLYQSASNTALGHDLYIRQDGNVVKWKWVEGMLSTGLLYGGVLSYSASSFLVTPGAGIIVDHNATASAEISPTINYVTWGPITQSIENIATAQNTFVYIDVNGSASQQNVFFAPEQYQFYIPLGKISHYDNVVTNGSSMNVQTVYDIDRQQNVFIRAFGPLKLKGVATSGQTGTLRLNIGSGTAFNLGGAYDNDPNEPSIYNVYTNNTASIIRIYRSGSGYKFDNNGGSYYTTINPGAYDDGTGTLAVVNNNDWSIQRVMVNPITGRAHVYYSQNVYDTYEEAVASISIDEFVESDATAHSYVFSSYLIVKGNTTDLTNVENKIVQAGLFRNVGGGGGTGGGGTPGGQDTQIQFNNAGVFDGEPEFTFNSSTNIVTLTGSMLVSGAISASFGPNTIGFFGTASWAVSASQAISASQAFSASYALSSSRAITASYALTSSVAVSSSYASASPNFANTDLVFTDNRKHSTNNYSYFIYSDLVGGNETNPFDGFGVSGSFYFFNSSSNALGTAAGSTNTYTYIEITSQSIDLSFDANPVVQSSYTFTKNSASFSSSLNVTKSVYFPGLTSQPQLNVVIVDTASGQLYYTASSAIGGGGTANVAISSSGTGLTATVASINFTGAGVATTNAGNNVTVTIPGGAGVAGGANTQIQFNSGSSFSGSGNFSFDYNNNIVYLTGSMIVSGAISASFGPNIVGFFGTASWAQNSLTASFITASNVWGPFGSSSIMSASYASGSTSASYAETASFATNVAAFPSDTYIQYNNNGSLGAEQYFRYIYTSHSLQHGNQTTASGYWSHAEGSSSIAYGTASYAGGFNTIASGAYSTVVGQYNVALPSQSAFIIGDGDVTVTTITDSGTLIGGVKPGGSTVIIPPNIVPYTNLIGGTITLTEGLNVQIFSIFGVTVLMSGDYSLALTPISSYTFNPFSATYSLSNTITTTTRHNLLFASKSYFEVSASNVFLQGLPTTPETHVLLYNTSSGQVYYTASSAIGGGGSGTPTPPATPLNSIQFNSASTFGGSNNFTFISSSSEVYLTGSMIVSGAISASYGPNTIGFYGTASWAQSASQAISASYAGSASVLLNPYPIAITGSTIYSVAPSLIAPSGNGTTGSIFLGDGAATNGGETAKESVLIGPGAGNGMNAGAIYSNAIGWWAGSNTSLS